jgi:hypothetical protein
MADNSGFIMPTNATGGEHLTDNVLRACVCRGMSFVLPRAGCLREQTALPMKIRNSGLNCCMFFVVVAQLISERNRRE